MMLSIRTYKTRKLDDALIYKTYRFPCFDTNIEFDGLPFEEKFNKAVEVLKEEIQEDRYNNNIKEYSPIVICDIWMN